MKHYIGPIIFRNVVSLANVIVFTVTFLLFFFSEIQAGVFLSIAMALNISLGIFQDIRARAALLHLELLTAVKATRVDEVGNESQVEIESIQKGDRIKLKLGDEVPCDGEIIEAKNLEVNQALITGESIALPKAKNESVFAGSIVVSGSAVVVAATSWEKSKIHEMTKSIQRYSLNQSPIQRSVDTIIKYSGFALLITLILVVLQGVVSGATPATLIVRVGALTSALVPQGLVLTMTMLFTYGAIALFKKHLLMQEINATEKLGRIRNLCIDKTGTLTENKLTVEEMVLAKSSGISTEQAQQLTEAYIRGSGDSSETIYTVKSFLKYNFKGEIFDAVPFSSARQFGAVGVRDEAGSVVVVVAAPDLIISQLTDVAEKKELQKLLDVHTKDGKRLLCVAFTAGAKIPESLSDLSLSLVSTFVLRNSIREGVVDAINFFQDRGTLVRVISGDGAETVVAVAKACGIAGTDKVITGSEMDNWSKADYFEKADMYRIFARVKPEQKEMIVSALKLKAFTAMLGDGANDALAIKKADLGIAMFEGASATRRLAAIVLMNNSFASLPDGVKLADSMISNLEMMACLFFSQAFASLFLFLILGIFGTLYPLVPQHITIIDYFTIGWPCFLIFFFALRPSDRIKSAKVKSERSFTRSVLPFSVGAGLVMAIGCSVALLVNPFSANAVELGTIAAVIFICLGFVSFYLTPYVFHGGASRMEKLDMTAFGVAEIILLVTFFAVPFLREFFVLTIPSLYGVLWMLLVLVPFSGLLCFIAYKLYSPDSKTLS